MDDPRVESLERRLEEQGDHVRQLTWLVVGLAALLVLATGLWILLLPLLVFLLARLGAAAAVGGLDAVAARWRRWRGVRES